ncbi:MAG: hypothetical protein K6E21_03540 [Bacilli bacterium]|nr:hypothetical protein [Bacilli bacterium]
MAFEPQNKYDKENTTRISIKLNRKTDKAIIDWLDSQPSKQGAIKNALLQIINKKKGN